jgi:RNA polymerase sigma factor (sigma-70 family)
MDDEKIVDLYWQRDENALAATTVKYGAYCISIARNILTNPQDAEECVNDTWLSAWNAIPPHRPSRLSIFLGKITRELSLNRYKQRFSKKRGNGELALALDELEECVAGGETVEQAVEYELLGKIISDFLRNQQEESADIFVRRYYHLCSVRRIAGEFYMSESKVKSILFRMRKKLRNHLESEGIIL